MERCLNILGGRSYAPRLLFDEGYIRGDELVLLTAAEACFDDIPDEEVVEVDAVEALVVEEGILLRTDVDEAKASLEGIDLPADEAVVKLFAEDEGGLVLGQIDMTDDLHLGRLERVLYAQRDLGLGACGELYGLGGRGGSISLWP